jgi:hypothetical protein
MERISGEQIENKIGRHNRKKRRKKRSEESRTKERK